jgi:hypothetical protein
VADCHDWAVGLAVSSILVHYFEQSVTHCAGVYAQAMQQITKSLRIVLNAALHDVCSACMNDARVVTVADDPTVLDVILEELLGPEDAVFCPGAFATSAKSMHEDDTIPMSEYVLILCNSSNGSNLRHV